MVRSNIAKSKNSRRSRIILIGGLLVLLSILGWIVRANRGLVQGPSSGIAAHPARDAPVSSSAVARQEDGSSLAYLARQKQRSLAERLEALRLEIDASEDPDAIFIELAEMIYSETDPVKRSALVDDIGNALVDFESPSEGIAWMKKYEKYILENFESIGSGKDGTLSPEGGFTVLGSIVGGFDLKVRLRGGYQELIDACLAVPASEMNKSKIMLDIFARSAIQAENFNIAETNLDEDLKQKLYKSALLQVNPQGVFQVEKYLGDKYSYFRDEGNRVVEDLVNEEWYIENKSKIDDLISGSVAGPSRDRFLSTLVVRSIKLRDGNAGRYLEQIQDGEIRRKASSEIERGG